MKRVLLILLSILMVIGAFTACGSDNAPTDTSVSTTTQGLNNETMPSDSTTEDIGGGETEPDLTETEDTTPAGYTPEEGFETLENIIIKEEDGKLNYKVIRPQNSSVASAEVKKSAHIVSSFSDILKVSPELDTDWKRKNDSDTLEILIGFTDYNETAAVIDEIKYGEYIIKPVGNKIVIMGYTDNAIDKAVTDFLNLCKSNKDAETKSITFTPEELYLKGSVNSALNILPVLGGETEAVYFDSGERVSGSNCDMIVITEASESGYSSYISKMENDGFELYVSTNMGKNKFATYTKNNYVVTIGYFPSEKNIRVTVESGAPLAGLESENKFTKITSSQLSLLGQEKSGDENGLSELIRLEDGRFIVIDGGHNGADYMSAFVAEIKKQAAEYTDKPVIAAWIITHAHSDHDGLFRAHAKEINKQGITVERLLINGVSSKAEVDKLIAIGAEMTLKGSIMICADNAKAIGAEVYKVHTGQVFYLANAKIEVIFTPETLYPDVIHAENTTSLVMKITFTDSETGKQTTFLSTGDATSKSFQNVYKNFKDYIDCDILSMAHHGGGVGAKSMYGVPSTHTSNAYTAVSPQLALWPMGSIRLMQVYKSQKDVDDILFALPSMKEVFVAGHIGDVTVVPLPYVVGTTTGPYEWDLAKAALKK